MEIKRGDIWYVSKDNYTGCEQAAGRPAIIVSNEKNNACAETVEVVYLTSLARRFRSPSVEDWPISSSMLLIYSAPG